MMNRWENRVVRAFRRLAALLRTWITVSLAQQGQGDADVEAQLARADSLALEVIDNVSKRFTMRKISIESIETYDLPLRQFVERVFAKQARFELVPFQVGCKCHKLALGVEMLTGVDRHLFFEVSKAGNNPIEPARYAELLQCHPSEAQQKFDTAWGRIVDTLSADKDLGAWLFGTRS